MRGAPLQKACRGRYPTISIRITSSSIKTTILFLFSMPVGRDVSLRRVSSLSLLRFMDAYCPEAIIILLPSSIWWGDHTGRYMPQQIPFTGINRAELSQAALLVAGLNLRQRILKNQYISVMGSYGRNSGKFHQILDSSESVDMAGVGIGYMYKSFLGPVEIQLNWSNQTKKVGWYAGFGFVF